jgi:hypothetical protein
MHGVISRLLARDLTKVRRCSSIRDASLAHIALRKIVLGADQETVVVFLRVDEVSRNLAHGY